MNGPEILSISRQRLAEAASVASRFSSPLPISTGLAKSLIQKSVRRGQRDLALRAAATLLVGDPAALWRRLACTAAEDVGVGDVEALGIAAAALGGKRFRQQLGGEWNVASSVITALCEAGKCRSSDDLMMLAALHPGLVQARHELPTLSTPALMTISTSDSPLPVRAIAFMSATGTAGAYFRSLQARRGDPQAAFDWLNEQGWPHTAVELAREGHRRTGDLLFALVALLSRDAPRGHAATIDETPAEEPGQTGVPVWVLDMFTSEGRAGFTEFLSSDAPSARWLADRVPRGKRMGVFGHAVFRVEGGLTRNRRVWQLADDLRRTVDLECAGCEDASELLELVRADIPRLNRVRQAVIGRMGHD